MRTIPLTADRATFEAYEARVESSALAARLDADWPETIECPRCSGLGSEPGTVEPCRACLGEGDV